MAYPQPLRLFPFKPNWATPLEEVFAFRSWVVPAAQGSEQTGSISGKTPRRRFEYEVLLQRASAQRFHSLLFAWMGRAFELPHWADVTSLAAPLVEGATVLQMDTTYRSFAVGGRLVIYHNDSTYESHEIAAVTASTVTIVAPGVLSAHPAATRVYPTIPGYMNPNISGTQLTDGVLRSPVVFDSEPSTAPTNIPVVEPGELYRGFELYMGWLNWSEPLQFNFAIQRDDIDFGTGKVRVQSTSQYSVRTRRFNWTLTSRAAAHDFRAWLGRREGRAVPVYMPTDVADFDLVSDIAAGDDFFDANDSLYGELAGAHPALRDVLVLCRDGRKYARRITGVAQLAPGIVRVALDSPIPEAVLIPAVKRISFLSLYRQASDDTSIRWLTATVGTSECDLVPKYTVD